MANILNIDSKLRSLTLRKETCRRCRDTVAERAHAKCEKFVIAINMNKPRDVKRQAFS